MTFALADIGFDGFGFDDVCIGFGFGIGIIGSGFASLEKIEVIGEKTWSLLLTRP